MTGAVGIEQFFHGQYNLFLSKLLEFKPLNLFIHSGSLHVSDCKERMSKFTVITMLNIKLNIR